MRSVMEQLWLEVARCIEMPAYFPERPAIVAESPLEA